MSMGTPTRCVRSGYRRWLVSGPALFALIIILLPGAPLGAYTNRPNNFASPTPHSTIDRCSHLLPYGPETLAQPGVHTNLIMIQRRLDNGIAAQHEVWLRGLQCHLIRRVGAAPGINCASNIGWEVLPVEREVLMLPDGQYTRYSGDAPPFGGHWVKNQMKNPRASGTGFFGARELTVALEQIPVSSNTTDHIATLTKSPVPGIETIIRYDVASGLILERTTRQAGATIEHTVVIVTNSIDPGRFSINTNEVVDLHRHYGIKHAININTMPVVGVGMIIRRGSPGCPVTITRVLPDSDAAAKGIKPGDCLLRIDGKQVADLAFADVVSMLRGMEGTSIHVTIRRDAATIEFTLTRSRMVLGGVRQP